MHLPGAGERRWHSVIPPSRSGLQTLAGRAAGVAAAPAGQTGEKKAQPRIVTGVDGSPASVAALRWAARQADLTGAGVEKVINWDYPSTSGMEFGSLDIDWAGNARAAVADALHVAQGEAAPRVPQAVTRGHPAEVLVAAAQGADLLIAGSRGRMALLGSVRSDPPRAVSGAGFR